MCNIYVIIWNIEENDRTNILLTHFTPLVPFYTPENIRKSQVFRFSDTFRGYRRRPMA